MKNKIFVIYGHFRGVLATLCKQLLSQGYFMWNAGPKQEKNTFWSFMAIVGVSQLPYGNSYDLKDFLYGAPVYWHASVSKRYLNKHMLQDAEPKIIQKDEKIAFWSFMAILGVSQLPQSNSYDLRASVYGPQVYQHD